MQSRVRSEMRRRRIEADLRMSASERVERALMLGEEQLRIFMAAEGIDRAEARRRIEESRARGRRR